MAKRKRDHANDVIGDDGLPLEPEQRRGAVAAQFDDFKRQLADLNVKPKKARNQSTADGQRRVH